MNPLSAFSFSKIIKSFIPGSIAAVGVLFLVDLSYQLAHTQEGALAKPLWQELLEGSFITQLILKSNVVATLFGAALIPAALMLGFFLNTVLWLSANEAFRRSVDARLDPQLIFARDMLKQRAREELRLFVGSEKEFRPFSLEAYYLPLIDFEKFSYLRESYFSWFEFQANSAAAIALSYMSYAFSLLILTGRWHVSAVDAAIHLLLPLAVVAGLCYLLVTAARDNLLRYQERLILFLLCCALHGEQLEPAGEPL